MQDDFLSRVHAILSEAAFSFPDNGIKGAVVGNLLRARGIDPSAHGYAKMSDLMAALEAAGAVKTGSDGKLAYTVWVRPSETASKSTPIKPRTPAKPESSTIGRSIEESETAAIGRRMLRHHVYNAFINEHLDNPRRIGTTSGALWIGDVPAPAQDEKWVEIPLISATEQQGWGLRFLVHSGWESDPDLVDSLRSDDWYRAFPLALTSKHGEAAKAAWNRRRTARVVREVDRWAAEKGVPSELLFEGDAASSRRIIPADARRRILGVISRMPTSELLKLRIPSRYWILSSSVSPVQEGRS